ncbi:hypothetical protein ABT301_29210 [Streptomyces sp. NPDC000987]|uniref:hypothetical protein n=1 Tax=Streptomyces sp. NPDC000987 TaxID=3154374 RepID=UPI003321059C
MSDYTQPDADENAVRDTLRKLGVRPASHAPDDQQPAPAVVIPPRPDYVPDVPAPGPRRGSGRLPDWWAKDKPQLGDEPASTAPAPEDTATGAQPDDAEHDQEPDEQPAPEPRRRRVEKRADADDQGEEDEEDTEDDDQPVGERPRGTWVARLRRPDREPTRPPFATAVHLYHQREKKSLAELVREIKPHRKWLLYAGSGFAAGWYFGIPQFVEAATASVAHHPGALRDNPDVYFWGVVGLVAVSLDRATRRSWFLIAWITRGLTVCLVVGAVLYGNPIEI